MLNVRDNEGFTNYSAVKGWDYKQKWRTNTTDLPRKFASSCANFFRSVRGLSREKIGIYEYSERVFSCNFFFHDVIVNFEPTRQALYPTLHLKRDKPWAFIAVIQGHHSVPYAESRHKPWFTQTV